MCSKLLEDRPEEPVSYIANMLSGLSATEEDATAMEDYALDDDEDEIED